MQRTMFRRWVVVVICSCAAGLVAADPMTAEDVHVQVGWFNPSMQADEFWVDTFVTPDSSTGVYSDSGEMTTGMCDLDWSVSGNADPVVSGVFGADNITDATQTYVMVVTLPLGSPLQPSTLTSGVINVTVVDNSGDGATMAALTDGSIYTSYIDGSVHRTLLDDASVDAPVDDSAQGSESFGLPGQIWVGSAAMTSISIEYRFTLTPGDAGTANGNFVVLIPEPATFVGILSGLALLAMRRRRA